MPLQRRQDFARRSGINAALRILDLWTGGRNCATALVLALLALGVMCGCVTERAPQVQQSSSPQPFEKEIQAFEAADRTNPPPRGATLFIGSSSIRLWKTLAEDFPGKKVINRGFGGSQIIHSVNYADRIIFPYKPKRIVIYAGGNDINAGKSPEQILADYQALVKRVHARLPRTTIAYISIAPNPARWAEVEKVKRANQLIEAHTRQDRRLSFIDVFPQMLGADGLPRPEIFVADRLHMNAAGYELWKGIVGAHLNL